MTNPNDLIPRKEVEKMVEKMIIESEKTDIPSTPQFNNMKNFARYELRNLLQELSQIESVNPIVIWFDPAKPWAERTYPLSAIGIDVSK